jgi:hypothetical protein
MAERLDASQLVDLAQRLRSAPPAEWTERPLRQLAAGLGWPWSEGRDGPVLHSGLATGDARLRPAAEYPERYFELRNYIGLHVPVVVSAGTPAAQADDFRSAAIALTDAFGPSSIMGAHGNPGPFFDRPPTWGSPFRRWRTRSESLELRAVASGTELALIPTEPLEEWHWRQGKVGEPGSLGGFFGVLGDSANSGLGWPGGWRTDNWDEFTEALAELLTTLPAECRALRIDLGIGIQGWCASAARDWMIYLYCDDTLQLGVVDDALGIPEPEGGFEALGWTPVAEGMSPERLPQAMAYLSDEFGAGQVDGLGLARLVVATARALGTGSPATGLYLSDWSETVGGFVDDHTYSVKYYGMGLHEGG